MADNKGSIDGFFESYLAAFMAGDVERLADHIAFPCHISGDAGAIALTAMAARSDYVTGLAPLFRAYRKLKVERGRIVDRSVFSISARLAQVGLHWTVESSTAPVLYTHEAAYTLVKPGEDWAISAIAFNEWSKLNPLLAAAR